MQIRKRPNQHQSREAGGKSSETDSFTAQLATCWTLLAAEAARLRLQGDTTAPLRALVLASALAEGALLSVEQARQVLIRGHNPACQIRS